MFSCFSSDFWCVPTTPAAGTAGEAAGSPRWHRRALLAARGWPTPAQINAVGRTRSSQAAAGGAESALACSKITQAGSLLGKLLAGCCVPHFLSSSSLMERLMAPASSMGRGAPALAWGNWRWVGCGGPWNADFWREEGK